MATDDKAYDLTPPGSRAGCCPARAWTRSPTERLLAADLMPGFEARAFCAFRVAGEAAATKDPPTDPRAGVGDKLEVFVDLD